MCWLRCWKLCCWFLYYVHNSDPVKTKSKGRVMFDPFGTWSRTTESGDVSSAKNIFICGFGKKNSRHSENESAKLCALRALVPKRLTHSRYAPYVPACLCALPIINTHLRALCALRAYGPYVPLSCLVLCYYN